MRSRVLTDDDLRDLAVAQGIPLEWAERDYLLVSIDAGLEQAFPGQLCFKGGFVLRHVYGHSRFSQDVDSTRQAPPHHKLDQAAVAAVIQAAGRPLFRVRKVVAATDSERSLDFDKIHYRGPIGDGDVSVEVSYREAIQVPPIPLPVGPPYYDTFDLPTMAPREMAAEKLRTLAQRRRPRDLLDAGMLLTGLAGPIDDADVAALIPVKFSPGLVRPGNHAERIRTNVRMMERTFDVAVHAVMQDPPAYEPMARAVLSRLDRLFR
jgi:predicted nucleotidyltransferase component of viral defense system